MIAATTLSEHKEHLQEDEALARRFRPVYRDVTDRFTDIQERLQRGIVGQRHYRVVVRWRANETHRGALEGLAPTGRQATITGISICRLSGDKIREEFVNWDALGLKQQLGPVTLPGKAAAGWRVMPALAARAVLAARAASRCSPREEWSHRPLWAA